MTMNYAGRPHYRALTAFALGAALLLAIGFAAGTRAAARGMIVVPIADARFVSLDPANPASASIAVLYGDPATGPSTMLMRFGRSAGRLHVHSSDYHLVVLQGTMRHRAAGETEANAPTLSPGSYWYQPGGEAHADSCLSEECLMFVSWAGPRDARLASTGAGAR